MSHGVRIRIRLVYGLAGAGTSVEVVAQADREGTRRARGVEGGVPHGELAADRRQRLGDEGAAVGETRRPQLGRGVVLAVEQVVDLAEHGEAWIDTVLRVQVEHPVAAGLARPQVRDAVRLVRVVLV